MWQTCPICGLLRRGRFGTMALFSRGVGQIERRKKECSRRASPPVASSRASSRACVSGSTLPTWSSGLSPRPLSEDSRNLDVSSTGSSSSSSGSKMNDSAWGDVSFRHTAPRTPRAPSRTVLRARSATTQPTTRFEPVLLGRFCCGTSSVGQSTSQKELE